MKLRFRAVFLCVVLCAGTGCGAGGGVSSGKPTGKPGAGAASPPAAQEAAPPAAETGGFDGAKAYAHVERLVGFGPRPPGSVGIQRAQEYIRAQLRGFGCPVEEEDFHASTPIGSVAMKNIVAKIPGQTQNAILLLTHYDTLRLANFVGAVDGGSSTGLMLEVGRLFCGRKNPLAIWIAFLDGEEAFVHWSDADSTYGSRELAAKLALSGELKRVKAVILADMIGPTGLKIRRDANSTLWLTDLIWSTAARLGYQRYFLADAIAVEDDHLPFLRRSVPAVDLIDLTDFPYWHTPEDTLDKVAPRSLAVVGHVIVETVGALEKKYR